MKTLQILHEGYDTWQDLWQTDCEDLAEAWAEAYKDIDDGDKPRYGERAEIRFEGEETTLYIEGTYSEKDGCDMKSYAPEITYDSKNEHQMITSALESLKAHETIECTEKSLEKEAYEYAVQYMTDCGKRTLMSVMKSSYAPACGKFEFYEVINGQIAKKPSLTIWEDEVYDRCMLKNLRQHAGLTQKAMSEQFNIPLRTIENWEAGKSSCPDYVRDLIFEKLESLINE